MGWRWYIYNETLDQYYYTGSSTLYRIQRDLSYVLTKLNWSLENHFISFISDEHVQIDFSKVVQ